MKPVSPQDVVPLDRVPSAEEIESCVQLINNELYKHGPDLKNEMGVIIDLPGVYKELANTIRKLYEPIGWEVYFELPGRSSKWFVKKQYPERIDE